MSCESWLAWLPSVPVACTTTWVMETRLACWLQWGEISREAANNPEDNPEASCESWRCLVHPILHIVTHKSGFLDWNNKPTRHFKRKSLDLKFLFWSLLVVAFPCLRGFWENVWPFIPCLRFFVVFFKVEISSRTLIPLFMSGSVHSGSASWDDRSRMLPDKLRVSSFPNRFPHYAWTAS